VETDDGEVRKVETVTGTREGLSKMTDVFEDKAGRIIASAFTNNLRNKITGDEVLTNALLARSELMSSLLDPRRDVDHECHYPETLDISPEEYKKLYDRDPIACRVVQCIARESWQVTPEVYESEDPDVTTPFEEAWNALQPMNTGASWYKEEQSGSVWEYLMRADILSGIGHFGVLLMGFDDGRNLQEPVEGAMVTNAFEEEKHRLTHNRAHAPDCYLTNAEETCLRSLPDLTEQETMTINQLVHQRELVLNRMAKQEDRKSGKPALFGDSTGLQQTGDGLEGTDKQYSQGFGLRGEATYEPSPMGTDQQYFGVQFGPTEQPSKEVSERKTRLLFLRPFDESLVQVVRYEWNINNPRFGMPVMYRITLNDPREHHTGVGLPLATVFVHWSRVIHLADNLNCSEIFGAPRMRPVLNRLLDLQKIYGASAEGYWQAAFTGIALTTHPQLGGDVTIDAADLRDQVENYVNSLQRWLALTGMSAQTLAPQVSDPSSQIAGHLEAVCIQLGIPVRIFKGSERGELASSQDDASWNDRLKARQHGYITPRIIAPFVDRLIAVGVLPEPVYVKPEDEPAFEEYGHEEAGFGDMDFSYDYPDVEFDKFDGRGGGADDEQGFAEEEEEPTGGDATEATEEDDGMSDDDSFRHRIIRNAEGPAGAKIKTGYTVVWPDLDSNTDKDIAQIAATKTQALSAYVGGNVEAVMPLMEFYTKILGFTDEEADHLVQAAEAQQREMGGQQAAMGGPPPGMGGVPGQEPGGGQAGPRGPQDGGMPQDTGEFDDDGFGG
jgi:hypothetical protein